MRGGVLHILGARHLPGAAEVGGDALLEMEAQGIT